MPDWLKLLIVANNYSHDFAAGILLASAVTLFFLRGALADPVTPRAVSERIFGVLSKLAALSLAWIIIAGSVRTYFYRSFELSEAAAKGEIRVLVFKHVVFFVMTGLGLWFWAALRRKVRI